MRILGGLIGGIVGVIVAIMLDVRLGHYLVGLVPPGEWAGLIKAAIVVALIAGTGALCFLPLWIGLAIGCYLEE